MSNFPKKVFTVDCCVPSQDISEFVPDVRNINKNIVAAGPLTKQPGTLPFRLTVRFTNNQIIVANQYFHLKTDNMAIDFRRFWFAESNYCEPDKIVEAMDKFCERLKKQNECLASLYREDA